MKNRKKYFLILIVVIGVIASGCAAMGVLETSDPDKKLGNAYMLFDEQQRPLPAERLIRESIEIYREKNDDLGLAQAYRAYGFFFRSAAIEKWSNFYQKNGFMEKSATYVNRHDKSIEYFEKSASIFEKHKKYDALTNVYLNMGFTYEFAHQKEKACGEYKKSIASNQRHMKDNPGAKLNLPNGYSSYDEYVAVHIKRLGCSNS
jgi:tetratricopeptide (TPR) repeat protein